MSYQQLHAAASHTIALKFLAEAFELNTREIVQQTQAKSSR